MPKPRHSRTSGRHFRDLFEPPRFDFLSLSMDKINKRRAIGLCIACGKEPEDCICKSTSKVRIVTTQYLSPNEVKKGLRSIECTSEEVKIREKKYKAAYWKRWKECHSRGQS